MLKLATDELIAAQDQMIAVIDGPAEGVVEQRPAAATGLGGGFVDRHPPARLDNPNGRREPRQSRADDVDRPRSLAGRRHRIP